MSEIKPQLTFNPDGNLQIRTDSGGRLSTDSSGERERGLDLLAAQSGIDVIEANNSRVVLVNVRQRFDSFNERDNRDVGDFLKAVSSILPNVPKDSVDRVITIDSLRPSNVRATAYQQFHDWLAGGGLTEAVAKESISAMAMPFGREYEERVRNNRRFKYAQENGILTAKIGEFIHVESQERRFKTIEYEKPGDESPLRIASLFLMTIDIGVMASLGTGVEDDRPFKKIQNVPRVYELSSKYIGSQNDVLSLILGIGTLAFYASEYEKD